MLTNRTTLTALVCAASLAAGACSENIARLSPSAPSPASSAFGIGGVSSTSGISVADSGIVQDADIVAKWAATVGWTAVDGFEVEGTGVISAVTGTCPTIVITVAGVPVSVNGATSLANGGCAALTVGRRVEVHGILMSTGGVLSVVATRIRVDDDGRGRRVAGEGTVASLTGVCPNLSMVVRGLHVTTNASTTFEHGECGNLRPGTKVFVEGMTRADGTLVATAIRIVDQPGGRPVEGEGVVGSLHGTCPTLTMVVHGYPVMTTSATTFTGGACSSIHAGTRIQIAGTIEANSVLATTVTILP